MNDTYKIYSGDRTYSAISGRIEMTLGKAGLTVSDIYNTTGVLINEHCNELTDYALAKIADICGVSAYWLMTGRSYKQDIPPNSGSSVQSTAVKKTTIEPPINKLDRIARVKHLIEECVRCDIEIPEQWVTKYNLYVNFKDTTSIKINGTPPVQN